MTCNSDLNSRDNCIYLTRSDRGYQTAHRNDKIVKISRLDQLLMSLLDSKNLSSAQRADLRTAMVATNIFIFSCFEFRTKANSILTANKN